MKPRFMSTSRQRSWQTSPRRIAVQMPVTISGRQKSSFSTASRISFSSSGVNGIRWTVFCSIETMSSKGLSTRPALRRSRLNVLLSSDRTPL